MAPFSRRLGPPFSRELGPPFCRELGPLGAGATVFSEAGGTIFLGFVRDVVDHLENHGIRNLHILVWPTVCAQLPWHTKGQIG